MSASAPSSSRTPASLTGRFVWQGSLSVLLVVVSLTVVGVRFELVGFLYLAFVTPELCRIDLAEHRLPNALVLPGMAFAAVGTVFGWLAGGTVPVGTAAAACGVTAFFALLALAGGMGMGDVKLAAVLALAGGAVSFVVVVGAVVLGFLFGGAVAMVGLATGGRGGSIAFGPYLLGGFWASTALLLVLG
ncbi:prepilin peptidase [Humibacter ginsenosidimutans]|uniref:prepilin peptidase n=1 Tax=Humibacter ginsenosidimutans TaxID=2599293 RepID=UPI00143D82A7|nr:prepilin peptidase [Humibacter ginsenosidimutans]